MNFSFLNRRFLIGALVVIVAGILQASGVLAVAGVKPNVLLVVLLALAFFFRDWTAYLTLLSVALFFVRSETGFQSPYLVLTIISGAVFLFKDYFPWSHQFLNTAVAIGFGTVFVYVFSDIRFLANDPFTVFIEVIYNVLVGVIAYVSLKRLIGYETQFRTSR